MFILQRFSTMKSDIPNGPIAHATVTLGAPPMTVHATRAGPVRITAHLSTQRRPKTAPVAATGRQQNCVTKPKRL